MAHAHVADAAVGVAFKLQQNTAGRGRSSHFGHERYTETRCDERENARELVRFEYRNEVRARTATDGEGVVAEAVTFFQEKKPLVLKVRQADFLL